MSINVRQRIRGFKNKVPFMKINKYEETGPINYSVKFVSFFCEQTRVNKQIKQSKIVLGLVIA